ncbi:MAG: periplasmic heavy metal sensor [Congregibacter sp.]|nr:periplasmic heavy metal sensor [Congregibacter sp.]
MNKQNVLVMTLLLSVAVNLLMAGFVIGKKRGPQHERPPMAWATESLSPETRRKVRGQMRAQIAQVRPLRENMRKAHMEVRNAVAAETFDSEALALALQQSREVSARYQVLMHQNLVTLSAELNKEQRIALARTVLQRGQNGEKPPRRPEPLR